MSMRQQGTSMVTMMEKFAKGANKELNEALIISAYEKPRFNTEKYKKGVIADFRDRAYLQCVKGTRK